MLELKEKKTIYCLIGLLLLSCLLFFSSLKSNDLSEREAREALAVFEMVNYGDFFLPKINGETLRTKPPLFHWSAFLFAKISGDLDEMVVRLPSALCAAAGVIGTFFFGTFLFNRRIGMLSSLILATNIKYFEMANRARVDMTLTFFVTLAYILFYIGFKTGKKIYFLFFFIAIGLAALTKGPVGILFPFSTIFLFLVSQKKTAFLREIDFLKGTLIILTIVSLWLVPALVLGGETLLDIIYQETVARFLGTTTHQLHKEPFYYYFPQIIGGFAPWSLFLPLALVMGFKNSRESEGLLYILLWFTCIFCFLSLSAGKRGDYLLPLYPAAALLVGKLWGDFIGNGGEINFRLYFSLFSFPILAAGILLFVISITLFFSTTFFHLSLPSIIHSFLVREDRLAFDFFWDSYNEWIPYISMLILILGILGIGHFLLIRKKKAMHSFSLLLLICLSLSVTAFFVLPEVNRVISLKPFTEEIKRHVHPDDKLFFYHKHRLKMAFYSGRHIPLLPKKKVKNYFKGEDPAFLIVKKEELNDVRKRSRSAVSIVASYENFRTGFLLLSN